MRMLTKVLVLSLAAAFASPAYAAPGGGGHGGGGHGGGGHGGGAMSGGGGAILSGGGGGASFGGRGSFGPSSMAGSTMGGGAFAAHATSGFRGSDGAAPHVALAPLGQTAPFANDHMRDRHDVRHDRHRHRRDLDFASGYYGFDYDNYDDPTDANQCFAYRKIYNARGAFVGWRQVDVCSG